MQLVIIYEIILIVQVSPKNRRGIVDLKPKDEIQL